MTLSWKELTGLYLGGAFCLPLLLIGFQAGSRHGLFGALLAIFAGNLILMGLALFTSRLGVLTKKTTAELAEEHLGPRGGLVLGGVILLIHLLWFALQLDLMANGSLHHALILGCCSLASVVAGLKRLSLIANLALPILMGALLYAMIRAPLPSNFSCLDGFALSFGLFTAAGLSAVIEMPTYFRKARSLADSRIASILIFGLGVPLIEGGGAYLGAALPSSDLMTILTSELSWVSLFLIVAGVTTNNNNLYAASVYGGRFFKSPLLPLTLMGIVIALLQPGEHIQKLLPLMALPLGSIGGVILGRGSRIAFVVGILLGFIGPIPLLSALLGSYLTSLGERTYALIQKR